MKKFLSATLLLFANQALAQIHNHGYIGKPQFDINEERFSLFDEKGNCKYRFSDIHFHPKNFVMEGDSLNKIAIDTDKNCVNKILASSLPLIEHWDGASTATRPKYYTDDKSQFYWNSISDVPTFEEFRSATDTTQKKFYFLINGFLHFDMGAIDAVKETMHLYPDLPIVGFGEIFGEHDIMSDQMNPPSEIDSKSLEAVYDLAAQKNWFVMIHNNLSHRSFKGATDAIHVEKIEKVLRKHKKTKFILPHAGVMRNIVIKDLPAVLDRLLRRNKNLSIDLSFVVLENYIMAEGVPNQAWIDLLEKHQDRFLIGTDYLGGYKDFYEIKKFIPLLDALSPEAAQKIAHDNFEELVSEAMK